MAKCDRYVGFRKQYITGLRFAVSLPEVFPARKKDIDPRVSPTATQPAANRPPGGKVDILLLPGGGYPAVGETRANLCNAIRLDALPIFISYGNLMKYAQVVKR